MPRFWPRPRSAQEPITEAGSNVAVASRNVPGPAGFVYGIPRGGTTEYNQGGGPSTSQDRRSILEELYQAYLTCPWSSACVDAIARTITAGGVEVVWDGGDDDEQEAPEPPPNVVALRELLAFVNPNEDIRQLMRGVIADLLVFGDAYIEVVWVGNIPAALYSLDAPSMTIEADEHGTIHRYIQLTEQGQRAVFEPREVIHISLDTPRTGLYGVSPTQKALLPITVWLFTAATLKETMRKGDPLTLHVDHPADMSDNDIKKWRQQYMVQNIGPRNIGNPITTKGGATVTELKQSSIENYLRTLDQKRDETLSTYGVPPSKVGIIESGNLGGGTGTSQDKTFRVNTCGPTAEAVMEKLIYHLAVQGFGITDWTMRFGEIDWRDDKTVDEISSTRLRDGRWTLNRARAEIGEPPVDGGDDPVLVDRQNIVLWSDMAAKSQASIDKDEGAGKQQPDPPPGDDPKETVARVQQRALQASWEAAYQQRLAEARRQLRGADE